MPKAKKIGLLGSSLFIMALTVGLVSCGPTGTGGAYSYVPYEEATYGKPEELEATVTLWHTLGQNNRGWLETLIREFNRLYPNITIDHDQQGSYDDIKVKIDRAIQAGGTELPTMAYCYPDHVSDYIDAGAVIPMDGFVDDPLIGFTEADGSHVEGGKTLSGADDFVKTYWEEGQAYQTSGLYSLPWTKSTELLFYNKDIFDDHPDWAVPTTWEDMWSLCERINEEYLPELSSKEQEEWKAPLGYDSDENLFITFAMQNGIPYTSNGSGDRVLFNNDEAKEMVTGLKSHFDAGHFITKGVSENNAYTSTFFEKGQVLMMVSSSGGTSYANTINFNVGVAPAPYGDEAAYVSQGPSICFFSRASWEERYAGWLFYRFCTKAENSALIATSSTGYDPVRVSSYESDYYQNWLTENGDSLFGKASSVTSQIRDDTFFTPVFPGSAVCRTEVGKLVTNVLLGTQTVDQAFTDAYNRCIAAL